MTLSDALQKEAQAAQRVRAEASAALFAAAKVLLEGRGPHSQDGALSLQLERLPAASLKAALLALVAAAPPNGYSRAAARLTGSSLGPRPAGAPQTSLLSAVATRAPSTQSARAAARVERLLV